MLRFWLLAAVSVFLLASPVMAQDDDLNCGDFDSQEEAQAEYESDTSDPNNLDDDDDGEACEDYDYVDNTDDSGDGGASEDQSTTLP